MRRAGGLSGLVLGCLLGSCSPAGDPVEPREVPLDTTKGKPGDAVQRGSLTVTATAAGEASQALEALGTPADRVPEAHIRIRRVGESPVEARTTDSLGQVTFTELLPGRYHITSLRLPSVDEGMQVAEADSTLAGISALGGGAHLRVQPPTSTVEVEVAAGRRGSLVISEIHDWWPRVTPGPTAQYSQARYIDVYNNGDTTVYLDGKILGHGLWYVAPHGTRVVGPAGESGTPAAAVLARHSASSAGDTRAAAVTVRRSAIRTRRHGGRGASRYGTRWRRP